VKANESFDPEVTPQRHGARSPDPDHSEDVQRRIEVLHSWMLVAESKRLLLYILERRCQLHPRPEDSASIEMVRGQLDVAEQKWRAERSASPAGEIGSPQLEKTYVSLIRRATTTAAHLSRSAASLRPADRLNAAVGVQMLDELRDEWRKALGAIGSGKT
jgi:hypothetical protein